MAGNSKVHEQIVAGVALAADAVESLVADGTYKRNEVSGVPSPAMLEAYERYQEHSAAVLAMFVVGEEDAAFWTQVELYAGFMEPAEILHAGHELSVDGRRAYTPPRVEPLLEWAAGGPQPKYSNAEGLPGDTLRHGLVRPASGAPPDMIWAPILRTGSPF